MQRCVTLCACDGHCVMRWVWVRECECRASDLGARVGRQMRVEAWSGENALA